MSGVCTLEGGTPRKGGLAMDPVFAWVMAGIIVVLVGGAIASGIRLWMQARRFRRQGGA